MYQERYLATLDRIIGEKIPVTFLSLADFDDSVETTKNLRSQGLNVNYMFVEKIRDDFDISTLDFRVRSFNEIHNIQPRPEYIFVDGTISARVALKNFPKSKIITLQNKNLHELGEYLEQKFKIFVGNLTKFEKFYNAFEDEKSRETFRNYFVGNVLNQIGKIDFSTMPHYLTDQFVPQVKNVVVNFDTNNKESWQCFTDLNCQVYDFGNKDIFEENLTATKLRLDSYNRKVENHLFVKIFDYAQKNALENIKSYNLPIIVFGAGKFAKTVSDKLHSLNLTVAGYAVDPEYYHPCVTFMNLPVYNFEELRYQAEKYVFVLGTFRNLSRSCEFVEDKELIRYVFLDDDDLKNSLWLEHLINYDLIAQKIFDDDNIPTEYKMLDDYIRENKIPQVNFLNINVQENEESILRGASEIILRFKPTIAITTHGKWKELTELVTLIKSIRSDYEFAMRQCVTTPKEEPEKFQIGVEGGLEKKLLALGLEVDIRNMDEVTLLAH